MPASLSNLADYHTHTHLCRHAVGVPADYVASAVRSGLGEIGISDHMPMPGWYDPEFRMGADSMAAYLELVADARRRFPHIPVRLGIEADYHPGTTGFVRDFLASHPFDYVLGSVHYLDDWAFDDPRCVDGFDKQPLDDIWTRYFARWQEAVESRLFDVMAHPDLVKKFGHRPDGDLARFFTPALERCAALGVAIEVSTAGLHKPAAELYPGPRFLETACALGVPVVVSSDAHDPAHVGRDFDAAVRALRSAGYRETLRFEGRRPFRVPL